MIINDGNSLEDYASKNTHFAHGFNKTIIASIAVLCIGSQIAEIVCYHVYYIGGEGHIHAKTLYWYCKSINLLIEFVILTRSIYLQRHSFHNIHIDNGTMQSNSVNIALIFMAGIYFSSLGALVFYKGRLFTDCVFDFAYATGLLFVAAHFLGSLRWGKISASSKNYHWFSANWWCCIYLVVAFFSFMIITVVTPWFGYDDFLKLSDDFENITGWLIDLFCQTIYQRMRLKRNCLTE